VSVHVLFIAIDSIEWLAKLGANGSAIPGEQAPGQAPSQRNDLASDHRTLRFPRLDLARSRGLEPDTFHRPFPRRRTMSRIYLAFACFFLILFRGRLPDGAVAYLPEGERPRELPGARAGESRPGAGAGRRKAARSPSRRRNRPVEAGAGRRPEEAQGRPPPSSTARAPWPCWASCSARAGWSTFCSSPIDDYDDADIGAAVRDIHRGCRTGPERSSCHRGGHARARKTTRSTCRKDSIRARSGSSARSRASRPSAVCSSPPRLARRRASSCPAHRRRRSRVLAPAEVKLGS
jgi:hypothetical protein